MRPFSTATALPDELFAGKTELSTLMSAKDWSQTALGPPQFWPQSLKTCVRIILTSRQAMFVWWGDQLVNLYNDAYKAIVGGKHPEALGQSASIVWAEIWDQVGPRAETAMRRNEGTYDEALLLIMERYGYREETYYTFSYSPVPNDQGGTGGIICANTDDTQRIIGQRQLTLLQELGARTANARSAEESCQKASLGLATNPHDLPFALIYLMDPDKRGFHLLGSAGLAQDHPACGPTPLDAPFWWPLAEVTRQQKAQIMGSLSAVPGPLPAGAWDRPPAQAVIIPLPSQSETGQAGVLVVGINPYRVYDSAYQSFLDLVARQISAGIASAHAYAEERKRAEALAELDRAKTTFFSNVSHEFRTPLTLMLGPLEDALAEHAVHPLPPPQYDRLDVAHRNSLRLLRLVNSLLDFSRIEAGRAQACYRPTDLATLTIDIASGFRSAVERAGLFLRIACPKLSEPVYVDRAMWEKIILNLLSNAFKFTFEGGITVTLNALGHNAVLHVIDTGVGVPAAELPRLFERFHRIDGQRSRSFEGSGIGLALVQELVNLHGGAIAARSEAGAGTAFIVTVPLGIAHLPVAHVEDADSVAPHIAQVDTFVQEALHWLPRLPEGAAPYPAQSTSAEKRALVLLADDNADMRDYVRRLLAQHYDVEAVADGAAALAAARRRRPELLLSDVMMPVLDGFSLLREIRADRALRDLPVILISARAGEEASKDGLDAGADDYLIKPFSAQELLARVNTNLTLARMRREVLQSVVDSEEQLRQLFEQAPGFMCTLRGPELIFEMANAAFMRLIGPREITGRRARVVLPEIAPQGYIDIIEEVYRTGQAVTGKAARVQFSRFPDEGMREVFVDYVLQPIKTGDGAVVGIFVQGADVTETKLAEDALRASEAQFRIFAQTVPNQLWTARPEGALDWFNERVYEYSGASHADLVGQGWTRLVHPTDLAGAAQRWAASLASAQIYETEFRIRRQDGAYRWHLVRALPICDAQGRVNRWIGSNTDIEDQKLAAETLADLNETLERRVEARTRERDGVWRTSQDLFVICGFDGVIRSVNPAWTESLGYVPSELIGVRFDSLVHPDELQASRQQQERLINGDVLRDIDRHVRAKDGSYRLFSWHCIAERDEYYASGRDMTERKHLEEQLRQSQKMEAVGQLTGGLAHDFNNLLTGIAGSLELLQARLLQGKLNDLDRYISAAQGASKRAASLTHRLLAFSRRQTLDPRAIDVNRLVAGMEELIARTVGPAIAVEVAGTSNVWATLVDPHQLESALLNLCINARDAMPEGGRLTIETSNKWLDARAAREQELPAGQYVSLCVSDTGAGMTAEVIARAFDPFFTTKPIGMGTGLGLSMIYGFARQSGGHVRIYSQLGEGTTVCIYLPRHFGAVQAPDMHDAPIEGLRAGNGETVLIVDDEPTVRMLITEVLGELGYMAIEAADGAAGLKVLQSDKRIDLMVTDVGLPGGLNGRQMADAARLLRPTLKVLFITGYAENAVFRNGYLDPGMHLLTKPFSIEMLATRIREIMLEERR
jgi:PAS domain S-box-containing protein